MSRRRGERGSVLIHAAVAMAALTGLSAFVIDYGTLLVSRHQLQNAVDAGALAGAVALGFDDYTDRSASSPAVRSAVSTAQANSVWRAPAPVSSANVSFPVCPAGYSACVRVEAQRTGLPGWFSRFLGITTASVSAAATAESRPANVVDCMKPWAIPDKWIEHHPNDAPWDADANFDRYREKGKGRGELLSDPDVYIPPSATSPGTGFTLANDLGVQVILKHGNHADNITPGFYFPIHFPGSRGGADYRDNIRNCNGVPYGIGDRVPIKSGNMVGPSAQGVADLIAQDPGARWNPVTKRVEGSCAYDNPPCARVSPRIVSIPLFDPDLLQQEDDGGNAEVLIVNILGFFIDRLDGDNNIVGYLVMRPGDLRDGGRVIDTASFLRSPILVE